MFNTENTFTGGSRNNPEHSNNDIYRFRIEEVEDGRLVAFVDQYIEQRENWRQVSSWFLNDIWGTKGIYVDFGQGWYIRPTQDVWTEIERKLNEKGYAGKILPRKGRDK
jgi:hypothetical protein